MIDSQRINALIQEVQRENWDSFSILYDLTKDILYHTIYAIVREEEAAKDILQETYLKLLESKMRHTENGLSYLLTIARNISYTYYKKRKREKPIDFEQEEGIYRDINKESTADHSIFEWAKNILKPKEWEVVVLYVIEGYTHQEIAKLLHRPLGTVLWQYNAAIKKLREKVRNVDELV